MSFKRTRVVMLSTTEKAPLALDLIDGDMVLDSKNDDIYANQHLYFLSDDEIKEGDWWFDLLERRVFKVTEEDVVVIKADGLPHNEFKKIIATTDKLGVITKDEFSGVDNQHLPQPSETFIKKFIEAYNNGNPIMEVMVEYNHLQSSGGLNKEWLKVNSSDNTITIRKMKDSWTRDEVVNLLQQFNNDKPGKFDCSKWIEENL